MELILRGEYSTDELDDTTKLFLDTCSNLTCGDSDLPILTFKAFRTKLRKWPERTSTSPSGRHLGHYKALICNIAGDLSPEERSELQEQPSPSSIPTSIKSIGSSHIQRYIDKHSEKEKRIEMENLNDLELVIPHVDAGPYREIPTACQLCRRCLQRSSQLKRI